MYSYFPLNHRVQPREFGSLLLCVIVYLVISGVAGLASGLLRWIPVLGWVVGILSWLIGVYCLIGIILAILRYFKA